MAEDDADEDVLLAVDQAEPLTCDRRQLGARRLGQHRDLLDGVRIRAERVAHAVAHVLDRVVVLHRDRDVARHGRVARHRTVEPEVAQLACDPRVGIAQQPDVGDALAQHEDAIEAQAHREARALDVRAPQHVLAREAALPDLDPLVVVVDVDLQAVRRVRVLARRDAVLGAGQERAHEHVDHLFEISRAELPGSRHPPQVELVRRARVQAVDRVSPVHQSGQGVQPVVVAHFVAQRVQQRRNAFTGGA